MATQKKTTGRIVVRQKIGMIAATESQRKTLLGLGLGRRHKERELENTPSVRGMIKKVITFLDIVAEK